MLTSHGMFPFLVQLAKAGVVQHLVPQVSQPQYPTTSAIVGSFISALYAFAARDDLRADLVSTGVLRALVPKLDASYPEDVVLNTVQAVAELLQQAGVPDELAAINGVQPLVALLGSQDARMVSAAARALAAVVQVDKLQQQVSCVVMGILCWASACLISQNKMSRLYASSRSANPARYNCQKHF